MNAYTHCLNILKKKTYTWLITGVAGFIGSNLLETLLQYKQRVIGLDNFITGQQQNLDIVQQSVGNTLWKNFTCIEGDIRNLDTCHTACRNVHYVLHHAALGSVPHSLENPILTNSCNVDGFLNMLVAARDAKVHAFVYAASSSTYGDSQILPKQEDIIGTPLSPYAVTKYVNELYADVFARNYALRSIGLRYFNIFGRRQDPNGAYAAVIPQWFAALLHDKEIYINGDGETSRDFCYIDNVIQINILAAVALAQPESIRPYTKNDTIRQNKSHIYNVACGERTTLNELFTLIRTIVTTHKPSAAHAKAIYRDFRLGDIRHSHAHITRAQEHLGYSPTHNLRQGLTQAAQWYVQSLIEK